VTPHCQTLPGLSPYIVGPGFWQMYTVHFAVRLLAAGANLALPGWFLSRTRQELAHARDNRTMGECGSVGQWVHESVGLWVYGSVGLWVCGWEWLWLIGCGWVGVSVGVGEGLFFGVAMCVHASAYACRRVYASPIRVLVVLGLDTPP